MEDIKIFNGGCHTKPQDGSYNINLHTLNWIIKSIQELQQGHKPCVTPYRQLKDVCPYLYEIEYDTINYDYAREHIGELHDAGKCSAVRKGNLFGRNLDWVYEDNADFIVRTPHYKGRNAVIGVSSITGLTNTMVEDRQESELYKLLPFRLQDGINEKGVFCCANVVPAIKEYTYSTPTNIKTDTLNSAMIVRWVLDNFNTAEDAVRELVNHVSVEFSHPILEEGFNTHYMIGDENNTFIVEFYEENGVLKNTYVIADLMTNFHLSGLNVDYYNDVINPIINGGALNEFNEDYIENYGNSITGIERWNTIILSKSSSSIEEILPQLYYSNTYILGEDNFNSIWWSEFSGLPLKPVGTGILTPKTDGSTWDESEHPEIYEILNGVWYRRNNPGIKDPKVWQTVHSCIYDIENKTVSIKVQEGRDAADHNKHEFSLVNVSTLSLQEQLKIILENVLELQNLQPPREFNSLVHKTELLNDSFNSQTYIPNKNGWAGGLCARYYSDSIKEFLVSFTYGQGIILHLEANNTPTFYKNINFDNNYGTDNYKINKLNCLSFGPNPFMDSRPILYSSNCPSTIGTGTSANCIFVFRQTSENISTVTYTMIDRILYNGNKLDLTLQYDGTISEDGRYLYIHGYLKYTPSDPKKGKIVLKFNLPEIPNKSTIDSSHITILSDKDIIKEYNFYVEEAYQDTCIYLNYLIYPYGNTLNNGYSGVLFYNLDKERIDKDLRIEQEFAGYEPEGICVLNNSIYFSLHQNGKNICDVRLVKLDNYEMNFAYTKLEIDNLINNETL